jgi:hypothetical protein
MGASFVGIRHCPLQRKLGNGPFVERVKLVMLKRAADETIEDAKTREGTLIRVRSETQPARTMTYAELARSVEDLENGIPECASCPLSGGEALGCYAFVSYPIDADFERLLFQFVVDGLSVPDSVGARFYHEIITRFEGPPTAWATRRGTEQGCLAARAEPFRHTWNEAGEERALSSADLLDGIFNRYDDAEDVALQCEVLVSLERSAGSAISEGTTEELRDVARIATGIVERPEWTLLVDA